MNPPFVPIVGSGFDAVAGQGQFWAGFNQRQDEANLARLQTADLAQNQWFSRLSEMQAQENQRRDAADIGAAEVARRAQADQLNAASYAEQTAEQKRQADAKLKFDKDQFDWKKSETDVQLKKQLKVLTNFATNYAPEFQDTAKSYEDAQTEHAKAQDAMLRRRSAIEAEKNFPRKPDGTAKVHFDLKSHEFVSNEFVRGVPIPLDPSELSTIQSANKELAALSASYMTSAEQLQRREADWKNSIKLIQQNGLVPKKGKDGWGLYSPDLDMTFGKMVADAKDDAASKAAATDAAAAADYEGVSVPRSGSAAQFIPQTAPATAPLPSGLGAVTFGGPSQPIQSKVWRLDPKTRRVVRVQ